MREVNRSSTEDAEKTELMDDNKLVQVIIKHVTAASWLPKYSQLDAVSDVVAGISLGLTLIPQSIAYAALAGLTAQYGLYSCFIGGFVYIIFGTVKEVSIGPSSLMSLITLEYTRNMPVEFVVLFCFLGGCIELLMGILQLGFLVDFISMPATSGFTSATSIIIVVAQLPGLLGLRVKAHNVTGNLRKIVENIGSVRIPDFILGVCSIVFLLFFRKLKDFNCSGKGNERTFLPKLLWFLSICRNALVILITSTIAFYLEKSGPSPFILSGKIESGFPKIALPPFSSQVGNQTYTFIDMCYHYGTGIIVLPLVSVLANVAIAKVYVSGSSINATQEMLTLGLCNIFGSFFSSMPTAGAFTRSAVISASGVRTPLAGLYVGIMTLLALSFLTPYFYYIPRATLAAVLISAVIFIIDFKVIQLLWKGNKLDAMSAIMTLMVSIIFGVETGLLVGALFNLILFLKQTVRPQIEIIHSKTEHGNKCTIIKPHGGLYYSSANYFCNNVMDIVKKNDEDGTVFLIDCERVQDVDYTTIKTIELLARNVNMEKRKLWLFHCDKTMLESINIFANSKHLLYIDDEEKISSISYGESFQNNAEEVTEKLLDNTCENFDLHYINNENSTSEIVDKNTESFEDKRKQ